MPLGSRNAWAFPVLNCHPEFISGSCGEMLKRVQHDKAGFDMTRGRLAAVTLPVPRAVEGRNEGSLSLAEIRERYKA